MNILDISPYAVYPPNAGGRLRIHYLNTNAAKFGHNVSIFSQDILNINEINLNYVKKIPIAPNYVEYRYINVFSLMVNYITGSLLRVSKILTGDILKILRPQILYKLIQNCNVIKIEHPWQFPYVFSKKPKDTPIVLVEHNAEFELYNNFLTFSKDPLLKPIRKPLVNIAIEKERFAVENAHIIFTVSEEDKNKLVKEYGINKSKFYVIPNGVDISKFCPISPENKEDLKKSMGFEGRKIILFSGSRYPPNEEAVHKIIEFSKKLKNQKDIIFLIVGTVGTLFKDKKYPNVIFTGYVNDVTKYFQIADIAINPMLSGSGTNIKMLDYMASGLPIITTKVGARGLNLEHGKHVIISEIDEFPEWIEILLENEDLRYKLSTNGRKLVEEKYDWKKIAEKELKILEKIV
ncbi:MAG TPA: glycosyltransferase [Hydrogenothermaceae bacterium]|nr:glycosyltransferase [Hydrogenothermaceae bacterium]